MEGARIVRCDPHEIYRAGVLAVLGQEPAFSVVGEAEDLPTALAMVDRLRPALVIAASDLPGNGTLALLKHCREPGVKVVVFAQSGDSLGVVDMVDAGAAATCCATARRGRCSTPSGPRSTAS